MTRYLLLLRFRILAAAWISFAYNYFFTNIPSRSVRTFVLRPLLSRSSRYFFVQMHCRFLHAPGISLGERSVINFGCLLDGRRYPIHIGSDVSIGPEASILTLGHDPRSPLFADCGGAVLIGDRAWIGYRAIILPGVSIGEGAVVGAGSVVTRDVKPFQIVAGNPARVIGQRPRQLTYILDFHPFLV